MVSRRQQITFKAASSNHFRFAKRCSCQHRISLWEIAVKISLGKLTLAKPLADVIKQIAVENIEVLPILPKHTLQVSTLPFHHRDPFDRIIVAQSQVENLPIVTNDIEFSHYGIKLL
ncbi:MAG TPA: type II toxin-antitoxin system VapC family toxin [Pyrinomonadaceae bacterium]